MKQRDYFSLHKQLTVEAFELVQKKNHDYASENDALRNIRACESFGVPAEIGLVTRLSDKLSRLATHAEGRKFKVTDETCKDTILDIINYAIIYFALAVERTGPVDKDHQTPPFPCTDKNG